MKIKLLLLFILFYGISYSQGTLNGIVKDAYSGKKLSGIVFDLKNSIYKSTSDKMGRYTFENIPDGKYLLVYVFEEKFNYENFQTDVVIDANKEVFLEISLTPKSYMIDDIYVYGVTKSNEKLTESPASVEVLYRDKLNILSRSNQIASVLSGLSGVDVLRNGSSDFIVNTRGFNSGLNRRILVLQDGRDVAMPLLGAIEWNSFPYSVDEYSKIEFVKGPSTSLYGANAFNGVLNFTSFSPKEVLGTKISLLGGDYKTFRFDVRNAGILSDKISYKVTMGRSQSLNSVNRRDSVKYLEYPGLIVEARPIYEDERNTYSNYGTLRFDYDFRNSSKIKVEAGYSNNGDETFVFGLGRTLVKNTERPYFLTAFKSDNFYFQAHYMKRHTLDTMWLLLPRAGNKLGAPLLDNSNDILLDAQYNFDSGKLKNMQLIFGLSQQFQNIQTYGTSIPNEVKANFTGTYGQLTYKVSNLLKFVGTIRYDRANIHASQISPRGALVFSPNKDHQFRLTVSRSFQRPNYSELFRLTPDAPAFALTPGPPRPALIGIDQRVADSIRVIAGWSSSPDIRLNLDGTRAFAVGNAELNVEKNLGFEIGYNGNYRSKLFFSANIYYNILTDFVTNFLPAVNKNFVSWSANLPDSLAAYNSLATAIVYSQLSARDRQRLSYFNGNPAFIVSNTNIGTVRQYGIDVTLSYYFNKNISLTGNYSHYNFNIEKKSGDPDILPNTSPNKINLSAVYQIPQKFDASVSFQYSDNFDWLAGAYTGVVPAYKIVNVNAGYFILKNLQIGAYVFNLFNQKHYQMFGGTYLPRNFNLKTTFSF